MNQCRCWIGLLLFGLAFGFIEAAVAIYLREIYEPIHQRLYPARSPGDLFPLIPVSHLETEVPTGLHLLTIELLRELATLVLLAALALVAARSWRQGLAYFLIAFGLWDLFYYLFLKILIDWPDSLLTWDLLFLLPVPWVGPVLAPLLVALLMISAGATIQRQEDCRRPVKLGVTQWTLLGTGASIIFITFCKDYPDLLAGSQPRDFDWPFFLLGLIVSGIGMAHAKVSGTLY